MHTKALERFNTMRKNNINLAPLLATLIGRYFAFQARWGFQFAGGKMKKSYIVEYDGMFIQKTPKLPNSQWFILAVVAILVIILAVFWGTVARAQDYSDEQIVNAIYQAEGGTKAVYAYGIRSIPYSTIADARRICFNTVRNNRKRFAKQNKYTDFLDFLGSRYCPVSAHPKNRFWIKNVEYFLARGKC